MVMEVVMEVVAMAMAISSAVGHQVSVGERGGFVCSLVRCSSQQPAATTEGRCAAGSGEVL